jgi:hypothetical protein
VRLPVLIFLRAFMPWTWMMGTAWSLVFAGVPSWWRTRHHAD